jgi:hypothetical protein
LGRPGWLRASSGDDQGHRGRRGGHRRARAAEGVECAWAGQEVVWPRRWGRGVSSPGWWWWWWEWGGGGLVQRARGQCTEEGGGAPGVGSGNHWAPCGRGYQLKRSCIPHRLSKSRARPVPPPSRPFHPARPCHQPWARGGCGGCCHQPATHRPNHAWPHMPPSWVWGGQGQGPPGSCLTVLGGPPLPALRPALWMRGAWGPEKGCAALHPARHREWPRYVRHPDADAPSLHGYLPRQERRFAASDHASGPTVRGTRGAWVSHVEEAVGAPVRLACRASQPSRCSG